MSSSCCSELVISVIEYKLTFILKLQVKHQCICSVCVRECMAGC